MGSHDWKQAIRTGIKYILSRTIILCFYIGTYFGSKYLPSAIFVQLDMVYRRIVKTPATAELAIVDENKYVHVVGFFSASQKTLKIILIR